MGKRKHKYQHSMKSGTSLHLGTDKGFAANHRQGNNWITKEEMHYGGGSKGLKSAQPGF
jgi:hypothetical protein